LSWFKFVEVEDVEEGRDLAEGMRLLRGAVITAGIKSERTIKRQGRKRLEFEGSHVNPAQYYM
jgi:hypothetical protein